MKKIKMIFCVALIVSCCNLRPDVIGSDTSPSTQPFFLFPDAPIVANRIANYAWMQGGFGLQSSAANLLFDSVFPVSGMIALNGGTLTLNRDFMLSNTTIIQSLGDIVGNGHTLSLSPSITWLPPQAAQFSNIKLVLNSDVTINSHITFAGSCVTIILFKEMGIRSLWVHQGLLM